MLGVLVRLAVQNAFRIWCSCILIGEDQSFAPLVGFECRGLEPISWQPQVLALHFLCKAVSYRVSVVGTQVQNVNL